MAMEKPWTSPKTAGFNGTIIDINRVVAIAATCDYWRYLTLTWRKTEHLLLRQGSL